MRAYIINLAVATWRKEYMNNVLKSAVGLDIEYIEAINGKCLTDKEKEALFDERRFIRYFGKNIKRGEIGCVLSHQKCYKDLIDSDDEVAIVFEDDIVLKEPVEKIIGIIENAMPQDKPAVMLLSAWYWYFHKRRLNADHFICNVMDARLAHAYAINKQAAKIMYHPRPWFVADDWGFFRRKGVKIYSLLPQCVDQNWNPIFQSQTNTGEPPVSFFYFGAWIRNGIHSVMREIVKKAGNYLAPY